MQLPKELIKIVEDVFLKLRSSTLKGVSVTKTRRVKSLKEIKQRQDQLEGLLLRTTNTKLSEKFEKERGQLENEKENLKDELEKESKIEKNMKSLLRRTIDLAKNPQRLREN